MAETVKAVCEGKKDVDCVDEAGGEAKSLGIGEVTENDWVADDGSRAILLSCQIHQFEE